MQLVLPDSKKRGKQIKHIFSDKGTHVRTCPSAHLSLGRITLAFEKAKAIKSSLMTNMPVLAVDVSQAHFEAMLRSPTWIVEEEAWKAMVVAFPKMITDADPINLAKRADAMVFSPESVSEEQAGAYWKTMKEAEKGVRRSVGWRRWITSRLSVRSFRAYK